MPIAATAQAAPPAPKAGGADASAHAIMAALPTSAHSRALEAWICALLMALLGHDALMRQLFPHIADQDLPADDEAALRLIRHAIRAENRLRARIAWLFRAWPNRAMCRTFGRITPALRAKPARAPPARRPHSRPIRSSAPAPRGDGARPHAYPCTRRRSSSGIRRTTSR
jgi:hypothetical protein